MTVCLGDSGQWGNRKVGVLQILPAATIPRATYAGQVTPRVRSLATLHPSTVFSLQHAPSCQCPGLAWGRVVSSLTGQVSLRTGHVTWRMRR